MLYSMDGIQGVGFSATAAGSTVWTTSRCEVRELGRVSISFVNSVLHSWAGNAGLPSLMPPLARSSGDNSLEA